ncbi:MAG: hypothetical protein O7G85_06270 [Planctomycetota bacterium]|nr:hypothetical protein [Planctomycetota bacterium]
MASQDQPTETNQVASTKTIVLVGHCMPDQFMIKTAVKRALKGVKIKIINDEAKLQEHRNPGSVLLVNRELDGRFETLNGIELIGRLANGDEGPVCLLISNIEEAQQQAIDAGAKPGFGKSDLYASSTADLLREAIGSS